MDFVIRDFAPGDAAALARMWNESDEGWPGTFTHGHPFTAETVMERFGKHRYIAQLLAVMGERIVGYCSVSACPGQTENVYIPLLNAVPEFHGKGIGKALLLEAVRRSTVAGYRCLDLHTWPGNMKAVPLYKKTGFFWRPDTSVHMENYLPQILPYPLMREFLDGQDWYSLFRRDLDVSEDRVEWHGIKVYPYEFESDRGRIRFVIDREANGITAVETPEFDAACALGKEDFAAGIEHPIRWEIRNKTAKPLAITLFADAEPGVALSVQESLEVKDERVIERSFKGRTDSVKRWDADRTAHVVRTTLVINGRAIPLQSAVTLRDPIAMQGFRRVPILRPGGAVPVECFLRSWLEEDAECEVHFGPVSGMKINPVEGSERVHIAALNWNGGRYTVVPEKAGGFEVPVRICFRHKGQVVESRPAPLPMIVLSGGRPEGLLTPPVAIMQNQHFRVWMPVKGGEIGFQWPDGTGDYLWTDKGCLGAPFDGRDFERTRFQISMKRKDDALSLIYRAPSCTFEGLVLEGRVTINGSPVVEIRRRILNESDEARRVQLQTGGHPRSHRAGREQIEWLTVPLKEGILRERTAQEPDFPGRDDLPRDPSQYAEPWSCYEGRGCAIGTIWGEVEKLEFNWWGLPGLTTPPMEVPAHGFVDLSPVRLYIGPGNWETVRALWASIAGVRLPERTTTISALEFGTKPSPLFISSETTAAGIRAENRRERDLAGTLKLELPEGFQASGSDFALETLKRGSPFSAPIEVRTSGLSPRAACGRIVHAGEIEDREAEAPVIVLGDPSQGLRIEETGEGEFALHTGWMTARVSAKHRGSLYALERNGQNHLFTSYPTPREFQWFNPWYGGMLMTCWGPGSLLDKVPFRWESVERTGSAGLAWRGIRFIAEPDHKDYRYYRVETDYLALPGSNLMAVIGRIVNKTGGYVRTGCESQTFTDPGGMREQGLGWYYRNGRLISRRRSNPVNGIMSEDWLGSSGPDGAPCLALVRGPGTNSVGMWDMGRNGIAFWTETEFPLDPFATHEMVLYLALTDTIEAATPYRALARLEELA